VEWVPGRDKSAESGTSFGTRFGARSPRPRRSSTRSASASARSARTAPKRVEFAVEPLDPSKRQFDQLARRGLATPHELGLGGHTVERHVVLEHRLPTLSSPTLRVNDAYRPRERGVGAVLVAADELEGHDAVALGKQRRDLWRRDPRSVDLRQVFVGRPTGDGAALSNEDRDRVIPQLREQLTNRRDANPLRAIDVVVKQQFGGVAAEHDRHLLSHLDRPVGCQMKRNRGACSVARACADEVGDPHAGAPHRRAAQPTLSDRPIARHGAPAFRETGQRSAVILMARAPAPWSERCQRRERKDRQGTK